jgi:protein-S-isoprenylcysteine O-methyltransferase Ste14
MSETAWWKGKRGESYVVVQFALFALVAFGPRTLWGWPNWKFPAVSLAFVAGGLLLAGGVCLVLAGAFKLGAKINAVPYPAAGGSLHVTGPYRIVRHPMYCGAVFAAIGWACWTQGWLTFVYAAMLFLLFVLKTRREERWLLEQFSSYAEYQRRVKKLIPFVY